MRRASPALVPILAISLSSLTAAGCKDSDPNYIHFDATADTGATEVRGDSSATDAGSSDAARADVVADSGASDTQNSDSQSTDAVAETASEAASTDSGNDVEQGQ